MKKGTKLYSIFKRKCPHCHEGDFFEGSFFSAKVKDHCEVCKEKYAKEPGFYQGSYYVVYALGVAVFVTVWTSINLFLPDLSMVATLVSIFSALILATPFMYPMSKIIWANFFFNYKNKTNE